MKRRHFLAGLLGVTMLPLIATNIARSAMGDKVKVSKIKRSKAQWRNLLSSQQYNILRGEGTERAYSSALNDEQRKGEYICAGCALPLFTSAMKYDSSTGWPSFFASIDGHVETKTDFKMIYPRTEYHCARCDGHQGHVFNDGPEPSGKRWCNNGLALIFVPA